MYGALLAYRLGYDRRKAWDHFTIAYQRAPFDPSQPYYPSVDQRKANVGKALQPPAQPDKDMADKNVWLQHIMQGMQKFDTALADNPEMAVA